MNTNKFKLEYGGLLISFMLYLIGVFSIVGLRSVGSWAGSISYEVTGVKAVLIGSCMVIFSFIFLSAFIRDLRKHISENHKIFNLKSLYILLILFYTLTPMIFIQNLYLKLPMNVKYAFFSVYIVYIIFMFFNFIIMYRNLTHKSKSQ